MKFSRKKDIKQNDIQKKDNKRNDIQFSNIK